MKAVFLDKDGTLIENVPFNVDPLKMRFAPGAEEALVRLDTLGYALFVVSNQPGVALGRFDEDALGAVERHLRVMLSAFHVPLAGFYYCPHHPDGRVVSYTAACRCRKPAPGLLLRAAEMHGADLAQSWLVGDILDDVEAGMRAGCRTILIDNGNETEWLDAPLRRPHHIVRNLREAADRIEGIGRDMYERGRAAQRALALRARFHRQRE